MALVRDIVNRISLRRNKDGSRTNFSPKGKVSTEKGQTTFLSSFSKNRKKATPPLAVEERRRNRPSVIIHHPPWKVPTINDVFPNLEGQTQDNPEFNLYDYKGSNWAMIFTHPTDFTPVCTSEFVELLKLKPEFDANNIKIVGFSTNVSDTHRNWLTDVEAIVNGYDMALENTVSQFTTDSVTTTTTKISECNSSEIKVDFPIYSDPTLEMAVELGILDGDIKDEDGLPVTARSIYILTPDNKIALITTYPSTVGRNWKEALRCALALQLVEKNKQCIHIPSHWEKGDKVLIDPKWTDSKCDKLFGKGRWERVFLPSEVRQEVGIFASGTGGVRIKKEKKDQSKDPEEVVTLPRHYMRYTSEPKDDHRVLESDEEEKQEIGT